MHHIHTAVNSLCASADIFNAGAVDYHLCMARKLSKTFLRQWRMHCNRTLVQVGEHLHMSHSQLSRIERGAQPYNQEMLEALAELYMCDPVDLLIRDPSAKQSIWTIWDRASIAEKAQIEAVATALVDSDTKAASG